MAHTLGPWVNDNGLVNGRESRTRFAPAVSVDLFNASEYPAELHDEMMANAALIAAAPDMLAALQGLIAEWDDGLDDPFWNAARKAVRMAIA